jgi:hypothetical protein
MILLAFALVGLLIALVRGGDITQLARVPFRLGWLALLAVGVQLLIFSRWWAQSPVFSAWIPILYSLSLLVLIVMVAVNWRLPGLPVVGVGLLCNALAISLNGGRMPASVDALLAAGLQSVALKAGALGASTNTILIGPETRLPFLCDIFALPSWFPLATVFSIGDVLIAAGAAWFFLAVVKPKPRL